MQWRAILVPVRRILRSRAGASCTGLLASAELVMANAASRFCSSAGSRIPNPNPARDELRLVLRNAASTTTNSGSGKGASSQARPCTKTASVKGKSDLMPSAGTPVVDADKAISKGRFQADIKPYRASSDLSAKADGKNIVSIPPKSDGGIKPQKSDSSSCEKSIREVSQGNKPEHPSPGRKSCQTIADSVGCSNLSTKGDVRNNISIPLKSDGGLKSQKSSSSSCEKMIRERPQVNKPEHPSPGKNVIFQAVTDSVRSPSKLSLTGGAKTSSRVESKTLVTGAVVAEPVSGKPCIRISSAETVQMYTEWWITCFIKSREVFRDLTFPLANLSLWIIAYQRVHLHVTGSLADEKLMCEEVNSRLEKLISRVASGNYSWRDKKHIHLLSPEVEEKKESGSPLFQDDVVQEALLLVLEPLFEARFSHRSHASRPGRNAQTAIRSISNSFLGCTWFIKGDVSFMHKECYSVWILDSLARVCLDSRVYHLIKSAFVELPVSELKMHKKSHAVSDWGSCKRLIPFLCNVFLDQIDQFMEKEISCLSVKKQASSKSSSSLLLFKPVAKTVEKACKLQYIRHGSEFLIGSNSSSQEVIKFKELLCDFARRHLWLNLDNYLTISHISTGVSFLDHNISQKVVHYVVSQHKRSCDIATQKRVLKVRLSINATRQCCHMYLKSLGAPSSIQQIENILTVLSGWYCHAENRKKVIDYCRFLLCTLYVRSICDMGKKAFKSQELKKSFKENMRSLNKEIVLSNSQTRHSALKANWVPKHEKFLRSMAWLLMNEAAVMQKTQHVFRNSQASSPQKKMAEIVWQFFRGLYPTKGDHFVESDLYVLTHDLGHDLVLESKTGELAQSVV